MTDDCMINNVACAMRTTQFPTCEGRVHGARNVFGYVSPGGLEARAPSKFVSVNMRTGARPSWPLLAFSPANIVRMAHATQ